jgi:hypothetical protein
MVATVRFEVDDDVYRFKLHTYVTHNHAQMYKVVLSEYGRVAEDVFSDLTQQAHLRSESEIIEAMHDMIEPHLPKEESFESQQELLAHCFERFAEQTDAEVSNVEHI